MEVTWANLYIKPWILFSQCTYLNIQEIKIGYDNPEGIAVTNLNNDKDE